MRPLLIHNSILKFSEYYLNSFKRMLYLVAFTILDDDHLEHAFSIISIMAILPLWLSDVVRRATRRSPQFELNRS